VLLVDAARASSADAGQSLPGAGPRPDDHPGAEQNRPTGRDPDRYAGEIAHIIGCEPGDVLRVSGKREGVTELLDEVVRVVPAPRAMPTRPPAR